MAHVKPLRDVRHYLTEKCVKILLAYRRNCASSTSPGQLILPESFKLLPLYSLAINKTKAVKGGSVTSDVRTFYMRHLRALGTGATMAMLYPRMIALHCMAENDGEPIKIERMDERGNKTEVQGARVKCPPLMRPSYLRMEPHGAYLVENGEMCILWLGAQVNPRLLDDLYGVNSLDELDSRMVNCDMGRTPSAALTHLRRPSCRSCRRACLARFARLWTASLRSAPSRRSRC